MKRNKIYSLLAALLMGSAATTAVAQQALRSAYFMEGYSYRHQMNPALAPERAYFGFPVLGNLNMGLSSNVGVSTFLFKTPDGGLTTFMNESVSSKEFMGKLKNNNRINADINLNIFSAGFRAFGGFNTIDLGLRSNVRVNLPYGLFDFMKNGMSSDETRYTIDNLGISTTNYAELAFGHSHRINSQITVGGKVKLLFGLADAQANINRMELNLTKDVWSVQADGELNAAVKGLMMPSKAEAGKEFDTPEDGEVLSFDDIDFDSPGLTGFGMAFDLGATYKVLDDLELSAALLDLGFIGWKNNINARTSGEKWSFEGFQNIAVNPDGDDDPNDLENQFEEMGDDLERLVNFRKKEEGGSRSRALGATLNIGAQYTLPYYRNLKFGFLSSTRINGQYSWSEGRFSANVSPVKCFDAGINYAVSSFGSSFGWIINIHPKGFNFFIGSDHQFFKVTPQFVPVHHASANFSMGINFPLGKRKSL